MPHLPTAVQRNVHVLQSTRIGKCKNGDLSIAINAVVEEMETPDWTRFSDAHDVVSARVCLNAHKATTKASSLQRPEHNEQPTPHAAHIDCAASHTASSLKSLSSLMPLGGQLVPTTASVSAMSHSQMQEKMFRRRLEAGYQDDREGEPSGLTEQPAMPQEHCVDLPCPTLAVAESISADDAQEMIQQNHDKRAAELEQEFLEARTSWNDNLRRHEPWHNAGQIACAEQPALPAMPDQKRWTHAPQEFKICSENSDDEGKSIARSELPCPTLAVAESCSADDAQEMIQQNYHNRAAELEQESLEARASWNATLRMREPWHNAGEP